jgi:DNA repair protein REV1
MSTSSCVQPLSCDEALLDVTGLGDPSDIAARLRACIYEATQCSASAGECVSVVYVDLAFG